MVFICFRSQRFKMMPQLTLSRASKQVQTSICISMVFLFFDFVGGLGFAPSIKMPTRALRCVIEEVEGKWGAGRRSCEK
jgi:hypothetical protein